MGLVEYEIIAIVVLILLYAMFSGLEIAIVGVRRSKVVRLYNTKVPGASSLYKLKMNAGRMTSAVNLGNTLVNVASSVLAADVAIKLLGNQGVGMAIGVMTFLILVFGEILPKTYCNVNPEKASLRFSRFLLWFAYATFPFVIALEHLTKFMLRAAGGYSYPRPITEEDIKEVVDQGLADEALEKEEHKLVRNALEFDDKPIVEVMTPKDKIFSLSKDLTLDKAFPTIKRRGFSRVPIYGKDKEEIIGILHIWDIAKLPEYKYSKTALGSIVRHPYFVYSKDRISDVLIDLKKSDIHMAVVLDEHHTLNGILTVEDLIEEIVGDITGEARRR